VVERLIEPRAFAITATPPRSLGAGTADSSIDRLYNVFVNLFGQKIIKSATGLSMSG